MLGRLGCWRHDVLAYGTVLGLLGHPDAGVRAEAQTLVFGVPLGRPGEEPQAEAGQDPDGGRGDGRPTPVGRMDLARSP